MATTRLDNIIRLRKWELDEERRTLADMQGKRDELVRHIDMLHQEVDEQKNAAALEVFSMTMGAYMDGVRLKQDMLEAEIERLDPQIEHQRDKVSEGYRELKTYEIAREKELDRRKFKELKEEQDMFDELAIQKHARQDTALD